MAQHHANIGRRPARVAETGYAPGIEQVGDDGVVADAARQMIANERQRRLDEGREDFGPGLLRVTSGPAALGRDRARGAQDVPRMKDGSIGSALSVTTLS
ncbi:MAG: hypothetical protein ACRCVA_11265 [Phreatobacter sp.]